MTSIKARIELLTAAALWGLGFIGWVWLLQSASMTQAMFLRFLLAGSIGALCLIPLRSKIQWSEIKLSFIPSVLLFLNLLFQVWGLKYTTATKSGFITCLYVLLVPIIEKFIFSKNIKSTHFIFVLLSLVGMAMMVNLNLSEWNKGDTITFICALMAAGHIISIDRVSQKTQSGFLFNIYQTLFCFVFSLVLCLILSEPLIISLSQNSIYGLLIVALGATTIAFGLQINAQKFVSSSLASILFLLEAPFAMFFAFFLLSEAPTTLQIVGSIVIFVSCSLSARKG